MFRVIALLAIFFCLSTSVARANVGEAYGFGSRNAALAGSGVSWGFDGFAAYQNPAGLSLPENRRLIVSYGLVFMTPDFLPINNVVVENGYNSDRTTPRLANVDVSYRDTLGQEIGLALRLMDPLKLSLGVTTFVPINQFAYLDTGETFVPEYVMYRARTQRPQLEMALAARPFEHFQIGVGAHLLYTLTGNTQVFLQTDPAKTSSMRFTGSLKPKITPYFGILITTEEKPQADPTGELPTNWSGSFGAVVRLPASATANMVVSSGVRALGSVAALDFHFNAASTMFYDPLTVELGGSLQHFEAARLYAQIDFQRWSQFQSPALLILNPQTDNTTSPGISFSPTIPPTFQYKDIWIPRIGEEITWGMTTWRFGYSYRPSIFKSLPTGAGNFLDPPKHIFTAGVGLRFKRFLGFEAPWNLDLHFAYHKLTTQHIDKTPGDETGSGAGNLKIGAPGYDAGGKILGGGVSLTLAF